MDCTEAKLRLKAVVGGGDAAGVHRITLLNYW